MLWEILLYMWKSILYSWGIVLEQKLMNQKVYIFLKTFVNILQNFLPYMLHQFILLLAEYKGAIFQTS